MPESINRAADHAIDQVIRAHGDVLERVAWGYVDNASDRDDLMQEILMALWRALPRFRGEASLRTFVLQVAHNRAITFATRRRRFDNLPDEGLLPDPTPAATQEIALERHSGRLNALFADGHVHPMRFSETWGAGSANQYWPQRP